MMRQVVRRTLLAGLVSSASVAPMRVALADTVQIEAEAVRISWPFYGTITSPMMIKDDPAASGGSYIMVAPGNNSSTTAPDSTTEGVLKLVFSVADTGTYRVWARVSCPTDSDDSFWVRMSIGADPAISPPPAPTLTSWIKWNTMVLGSAFHWIQVKPDGATNPSTFNLKAGAVNELHIAYREDGTKLDAVYVTSDTSFNPNAALTGPPAPPIMQPFANGGGSTKISWSSVPGATSYTLEKMADSGCSFNETTQCCESSTPYTVIASGLTKHTFTEVGGGGKYRVTAVAPTGSSSHPLSVGPNNCHPFDPSEVNFADSQNFYRRASVPEGSVTSPMQVINFGVGAPVGTDSNSSVPAHGRYRMDFELAATATMRMWALVQAPNGNQDSFWVRWDDGAWINWNNLGVWCPTLWDSGKSGSPTVRQTLGPGSHRIEWAYREGGARLYDTIVLRQDDPDLFEDQCSD
jgi:hypothetical protein